MTDRTETVRVQPLPARSSTLCLRILSGPPGQEPVRLTGQSLVIGRDRDTDVRLSYGGVSRRHAKITCSDGGQYTIIDLGSKNGTFVNGAQIEVAPLRPGDRIDLGKASLEFGWTDPPAGRAATGSQPSNNLHTLLSPRELEVARLVAEGITNAEIGNRFGISRRTVATHLENIYQRLDIHSRAALVRLLLADS